MPHYDDFSSESTLLLFKIQIQNLVYNDINGFLDFLWYGMVWYGMVWYGMVRYGTVSWLLEEQVNVVLVCWSSLKREQALVKCLQYKKLNPTEVIVKLKSS